MSGEHLAKRLLRGAVIVTCASAMAAAQAAERHVPGSYSTIQDAVDASVDGDEVVIADGVYSGAGNVNVDLQGKRLIVRSANGAASCTIDGTNSARAFRVDSGEPAGTRIEGLTLRNCVATGSLGGAIVISGGNVSLEVAGCSFNLCEADQGGAIAVQDFNTSISVVDCTFGACEASIRGGGIWAALGTNLTVERCVFDTNAAAQAGGAIFSEAATVILDSTFDANDGGSMGGGALWGDTSSASVEGCTFTGNYSELGFGGAIVFQTGTLIASNCSFVSNSAKGSGAISIRGGYVANCSFDANTCTDFLLVGGGAAASTDSTFVNCLFTNNESMTFGGAMVSYGDSRMINCVFWNNSASTFGGAVVQQGTNQTSGTGLLANSILWSNNAGDGHELALLDSFTGIGADLQVGYCDIMGGESEVYISFNSALQWLAGNIDVDPAFVDATGGDFHVLPGSPVIDAADNTTVPDDLADLDSDFITSEPVPLDFDGLGRFVDDTNTGDTGNGTAPIVDMGAFEFQDDIPGPLCPHAYVTVRGIEASGSFGDICDSDDIRWRWQPDALAATLTAPINLEFVGTVSQGDGDEIRFTIEQRATHSGVVANMAIYNFLQQQYESVVIPNVPTIDTIYEIIRETNVSEYIGADNEVRGRITYTRPQGVPPFWRVDLDQVSFFLE